MKSKTNRSGIKFLAAAAICAFSALTAVTASAQSHYESRIYLGAHGGADLSRVSFTPSVTQSFLPGGNAGINFRYIEEKHFGLIVEANWEQRGWRETFEDLPYEYSRTSDFITIPALAHIYFGRRGKFFVNLGPSVSFLLGESTKANFDYKDANNNPDLDSHIKYQYDLPISQKVDYGILGGVGGEFSLNPRNSIYLDARFYFGLANVVKTGRAEAIRGANQMNIVISAGYWFRLK